MASETIRVTLVLTGGRAGRTCVLNKYQFVNGRLTLAGDLAALAGVIKYMGRSFKAFPEGSEELAFYQEQDRQRGGADGQRNVPKTPELGDSKTAQPNVPAGGPQSPQVPAKDGEGSDSGKTGPSGSDSVGAGQASGIEEALRLLDPKNKEHWTGNGMPRVDVVSRLLGKTITREDILAVAPGFVRPE